LAQCDDATDKVLFESCWINVFAASRGDHDKHRSERVQPPH